jgi:hypothetical protein
MITDIILTAPDTYSADVDGTVWSGITEASRFWQDVQDAIAAGEPVGTPPVQDALTVERESMELSFAQMLIGLEAEAWITTAEATAWLVNRVLPPPVVHVISQLPADQRFAATARAVAPSVVKRTNPLVDLLGAVASKTPTQIDQFFKDYRVV